MPPLAKPTVTIYGEHCWCGILAPVGMGGRGHGQIQALAHLLPICLPALRIVCATGPAPGAFSDVVTVNVSKEGRSREQFSYVVSRPPPLTVQLSLHRPAARAESLSFSPAAQGPLAGAFHGPKGRGHKDHHSRQ